VRQGLQNLNPALYMRINLLLHTTCDVSLVILHILLLTVVTVHLVRGVEYLGLGLECSDLFTSVL